MKAIELVDGRLAITDLGLGNCPTLSPAGDRIAFLNNSTVGGAEQGVWIMNADGSRRRLLGEYGRPKWSPDSRQFMIVSFSNPCQVTFMDVRPERSGALTVPGQNIYPLPSWASAGTIAAVMGSDVCDTIALIDVTNPAEGRVKEILWKRANGTDLIRPTRCTRPSRVAASSSAVDRRGWRCIRSRSGSPNRRDGSSRRDTTTRLWI